MTSGGRSTKTKLGLLAKCHTEGTFGNARPAAPYLFHIRILGLGAWAGGSLMASILPATHSRTCAPSTISGSFALLFGSSAWAAEDVEKLSCKQADSAYSALRATRVRSEGLVESVRLNFIVQPSLDRSFSMEGG